MTPVAYSPEEAANFIATYGSTPVKGGPIPIINDLVNIRPVVSLSDYVESKYPPYGVIVHPNTSDVLVWFDARGALHVIDVTGNPIANEVPRAPFQSPDGSVIEDMLQRVDALVKGLPSASQAGGAILVAAVIAAVLIYRK